jgi:hypothetical protein
MRILQHFIINVKHEKYFIFRFLKELSQLLHF